MKRISTKIGDVFSVKLNNETKKYFQLVAFDLTQLNSDVVRGFTKIYPIIDSPKLSEIINDTVDFYAHCITKLGLKMNLWEKIGNILDLGEIEDILFKGTSDYARKADEEPVNVSEKWYVWRVNDNNFTRVGKLEGDNKKAEIGIVMNPYDIVDRLKTGKYNFFYPE